MRPEIYQRMAEVEARHWWFVGRRRIVDHLIAALDLPADATILDAGCGTDGNLAMLARNGLAVQPGQLPDGLPAAAERLGLVTLLDVLEHLDDGLGVAPAPLDRTLTAIFASERHLIGRLPLPVGASLPMCARRPAP